MTYKDLEQLISQQMRMSHIYQPAGLSSPLPTLREPKLP